VPPEVHAINAIDFENAGFERKLRDKTRATLSSGRFVFDPFSKTQSGSSPVFVDDSGRKGDN